jgi:protein Tex
VIDALMMKTAAELNLVPAQVARTIALLDDGNTLPFIARYRKEVTGGLDEMHIEAIGRRMTTLRALEARRAEVLRLIGEQGKLTADLEIAIAGAVNLQELEDLYLPYRPKRRTRAMIARERGLEPLAHLILDQKFGTREALAAAFVDPARSVADSEEALAGARDIVAEEIAEDAGVRADLRELFAVAGRLEVSVSDQTKDTEGTFAQYYTFTGALSGLPPHRLLAINRGEREGILRVRTEVPDDAVTGILAREFPADDRSPLAGDLRRAAEDGYERLLAPSLEREIRAALTERAEEHAIGVFAANLKPLLLQPPLRGRAVIGIDPGFRTGCKVAVVDQTGKVLETGAIFPHPPQGRAAEARAALTALAHTHHAKVFAIGTGTAGRETEMLVAEIVATLGPDYGYVMVDEAGASVYSVSEAAREEFPELDATARGTISIARRLQDPLAELVKVDPRSIGVGLYQHDVDQGALAQALDRVVESAVNFAGVDVNTASAALLRHVAGLNRKVASSLVRYRNEHGAFRKRADLKRVTGLGPRAFEQAAGFLKVPESADILDRTFIHPESYAAGRALIDMMPPGQKGETLPGRAARFAAELATRRGARAELASRLGIGEPTLADMLDNLAKPGLDPRTALPQPLVRTSVLTMEELQIGMVVQGVVRNVVDFGAFVDIGLKQAGLVHVSELADRFVRSPLEVVQVGQVVRARIIGLDQARSRIGLSLKSVGN